MADPGLKEQLEKVKQMAELADPEDEHFNPLENITKLKKIHGGMKAIDIKQ